MSGMHLSVDRRLVLAGLAAGAAAALPGRLPAAAHGDGPMIVSLADLHSAYGRLPAILAALRALPADRPKALLINGDIFERGNVVALRSDGAPDWAFLDAAAALMPVVVNIGNHETALLDDLALFVDGATSRGLSVISNLVDTRSGAPFAPDSVRLDLGGTDTAILGVATTNPFVYRAEVRETLGFRDPAQHVAETLPSAAEGADLIVVMSHAGITADKAILAGLPEDAVLLGAHDHLDFASREGGIAYLHHAAWGTRIATTEGGVSHLAPVAGDAPADADLARIVAEAEAAHLTDEDRTIVATLDRDRDIHASILLATEALRQATGADIAALGHTTFGAPLSAGPLRAYDFDAFVRFGGGVSTADVPGERLSAILSRANQFAASSLDQRTGDYVHVRAFDVDPAATYRLAVNNWTAMNQATYLGTEDLTFAEAEGLELKALIRDYLSRL